jgi:hypothetical protein
MKKTSIIKKAKVGTTAPKAKAGKSLGMKSVKAGYDKNPGVTRADIIVAAKKKAMYGKTMKAQDGTSKKKYQYFWEDPEGTTYKRNEEARRNSKLMDLTNQILPQDKVQKFGKFEGYKYYDSPTSESPKLLNDAARLAKKPNVTKAATPSLSKKDIKTYKKTRAAPKAKKGVSVKKTSMGKCKMGC